jgi:PPOX class probable FMN-dependent enzyme
MADQHSIPTIEQLEAIYGHPAPDGPAVVKEIDHISEHYQRFIEVSPFMVLATAGPEGLDCSPRGDPPGFVRVVDSRTVMIPDRRGNNRIDSLRNIVRDGRVALLFLIPGIGATLRINGRSRAVRLVRDRGQAAALDYYRERRARIHPVPQGAGALRLVEPGASRAEVDASERRRDHAGPD